jgi:hypothetical protein
MVLGARAVDLKLDNAANFNTRLLITHTSMTTLIFFQPFQVLLPNTQIVVWNPKAMAVAELVEPELKLVGHQHVK